MRDEYKNKGELEGWFVLPAYCCITPFAHTVGDFTKVLTFFPQEVSVALQGNCIHRNCLSTKEPVHLKLVS